MARQIEILKFLVAALLLLVFPCEGQTPQYLPVTHPVSSGALAAAVTACGSAPCTIWINNAIALPSNQSIPANVTLEITAGGQLQPAVATTLTINGTIIAGANAQIFGGAGSVAGLVQARPEWFGTGSTSAAFLAAYNALSSNGSDLLFQVGTYTSPFNQVSGTIGTKNSVRMIGSGMGDYNTAGTQVVGGTIIQGQMQINASYVGFRDLCIDDGSAVIAASFGSAIGNGLDMADSGSAPYKGVIVQNVCVLNATATTLVHDMLFEHMDHLYATNLNTLFATHGVILKGTHSTIVGVHARGHNSDGIILKADAAIPFQDNSVSDVHVESFNANDTGPGCGGVCINAGTGSLLGLNISNVTLRALGGPGIALNANTGVNVSDVEIANVNADAMTGSPATCIWGQNLGGVVQRIHLVNMQCNNTAQGIRLDSNNQAYQIENISVDTATGDGIYVNGGAYIQISNYQCFACVGFAVNWVSGFGGMNGVLQYTGGGVLTSTFWQAAAGTTVNGVTFAGLTTGTDILPNGTQGTSISGAIAFPGTIGVTGLATMTGGFKAGSSGSTIPDTRALIQSIVFCTGGTVACTQTSLQSAHSVTGFVGLTAGTVTVTGIPAYTSASTYWCTVTDDSAIAATRWVPVSGTSFTITGTGGDTVIYNCNGF